MRYNRRGGGRVEQVWRALFVAKYPEQLHDRALARHGWKERLRLVHACWHHGKFAVRHSLATHTRFGGIRCVSHHRLLHCTPTTTKCSRLTRVCAGSPTLLKTMRTSSWAAAPKGTSSSGTSTKNHQARCVV